MSGFLATQAVLPRRKALRAARQAFVLDGGIALAKLWTKEADMAEFTIHAAKTNLSQLIARALAGEEVIVKRGSQPVVRLVPIRQVPKERKFGAMRGRIKVTDAFFEPLPDEELDAWQQ
jgi:prevent-host-death family protein